MSTKGIEVPYNHDLQALEKLLSKVRRPGDFFVEGKLEAPMPRIEVEGVGVLSFPVPGVQIQQLIHCATRAPYGRGEDTILDESVRKVWQVAAEKVRLGGKSWDTTFQQIVAAVSRALGCGEMKVIAELYKLLIYDQGGFFKAHRDTEKAEGMFGTLVVVLPSAHRGGELVIRHAGREVTVDLSGEEVSELRFAAFYADCQHEVLPITEGNRVCLVYNLLQSQDGAKGQPLTAPLYAAEMEAAADMLREAFAEGGDPAKLVWLLKHEYSPAGLSFAGLKGEDAALAKVLQAAAQTANCAVHLGILHISESGGAEPSYDDYRPRRWRRRYDDYGEDEPDDGGDSDSFEVIDVSDSSCIVDQWRDISDRAVDFGPLPVAEGEVLPAGALDGEQPDTQRVTEATGNEGASFERAYHRAALVIWPRDRFADVLLQAGVGAVLPHLAECITALGGASGTAAKREAVVGIASRAIEAWDALPTYSYHSIGKEPSRADMIQLLGRLGEAELLAQFVDGVVTRQFDGSETALLTATAPLLGPEKSAKVFAVLIRENMRWFPGDCVRLLTGLANELGPKLTPDWKAALTKIAGSIVAQIPALKRGSSEPYGTADWPRAQQAKPVDSAMVTELLEGLRALDERKLRTKAAEAMITNTPVFDPGTVVVPALTALNRKGPEAFAEDVDYARLWQHSAEFLLARSEQPPAPPTDWKQEVKIACNCEDCRELQAFVRSPSERVHRFRVRQDRRHHLHMQIEHHQLDMTHETERKGSPQTLVCTKTRRTFQRQCDQHAADCANMKALLQASPATSSSVSELIPRLKGASERKALQV